MHDMKNGENFLKRLHDSLERQTHKDWELIVTREGKMAENTNAAIKKARGEIIKILFMDDFFYSPDALKNIEENIGGGWCASGCVHTTDGDTFFNPHDASYDEAALRQGINTIGSPSVIAFRNSNNPPLFDENMSWLLDVDFYLRLYDEFGPPKIIPSHDIAMGIGDHQMTNIMSDKDKEWEANYLQSKLETWKSA